MTTYATLQGIPEPTLRRLPAYCHLLRRLVRQEIKEVSCTQIGRALDLDPTQVRKDLAVTGVNGRPKIGYQVPDLCDKIESFLGWNNTQDAVLVGVGSLGTALLGYKPFTQNGVRIVAAFDTDPHKVEERVHDTPVFPIEKLPNLLERLKIHVGILTVPVDAAQSVCNLMVLSGVRAIWNFAPTALEVPDGVIVQNENLFSSLGVLSSKLAAMLRSPAHIGNAQEG
jgi:redox-sensing transcriptional repressor